VWRESQEGVWSCGVREVGVWKGEERLRGGEKEATMDEYGWGREGGERGHRKRSVSCGEGS
jgi:hypothetical protein